MKRKKSTIATVNAKSKVSLVSEEKKGELAERNLKACVNIEGILYVISTLIYITGKMVGSFI